MEEPAPAHKIWRHAYLPDLELQRGTDVRAYDVGPHFHDAYQFVLMEAGSRLFRHRKGSDVVEAGGLTTILPGQVHAVSSSRQIGSSFLTIHLPTRYVDEIDPEINRRLEQVPFAIRETDTAAAFRRLNAQLAAKSDRGAFDETLSDFLGCLTDFAGTSSDIVRSKFRMKAARDLVHDSFRENLSLDEIAAMTGLSKFHFVREFTRSVGASPLAYRNAIRTVEAKRLLCSGRPIKVIAFELGFVDESHFGRIFRQKVGFSPAAYRKAMCS